MAGKEMFIVEKESFREFVQEFFGRNRSYVSVYELLGKKDKPLFVKKGKISEDTVVIKLKEEGNITNNSLINIYQYSRTDYDSVNDRLDLIDFHVLLG